MSEEITYEAARQELQQIVSRLESGGEDLAATMTLWARGEELAQTCQRFLDGARETIAAARAAREGEAGGPAAERREPEGR